ncbi:hypothetical protein E2I00_018518 [Balaenoptera physalus]|uniref:Uncharacterized protein n=1 Tax=Balaenoptera physalus TaxID=9770 RepID=A0A6A1QA12_BALPH|nr:hypothetical protein E2I00_018518 [Balaenoptera physalus]
MSMAALLPQRVRLGFQAMDLVATSNLIGQMMEEAIAALRFPSSSIYPVPFAFNTHTVSRQQITLCSLATNKVKHFRNVMCIRAQRRKNRAEGQLNPSRASQLMVGFMCRALRGRRKENKKEELPEDQTSPYSQMLQKGQGAQTTDDKTKETGGDKAAEEGPPPGKTEPRKDAKNWKLPVPLGTVYPPLLSSLSSTKAVGRSWELSPPTANSFQIHDVSLPSTPFSLYPLQTKKWECAPSRGELSKGGAETNPNQRNRARGPFRHFMDMKAEKRLAGRKEHYSCFGDINVHKCSQFGHIFCPFQALATTVSKLFFCTGL